MKRNYDVIDFFKFIACLSIIAIHTAFGSDFMSKSGYYVFANGFLRLAVPYFFVVSGFFFGKKIEKAGEAGITAIKGYCVRLLYPLVFWEIINIVIEILKQRFIQHLGIAAIILNVIKSVLFYPYGALWYVQALIIATIIVYFALKHNKLVCCLVAGVLLYLCGLLANTYYFLIVGSPIQSVIDWYLCVFVSSRNALFVGLFFVATGVTIAKYERIIEKRTALGALVLFAALFVMELTLIRGSVSADDRSMYIAFVGLIPAIVTVLIKSDIKIKCAKELRNYSTSLYFMHKAVIHVWLVIQRIFRVTFTESVEWFLVVGSCFVICQTVYKINNKWLNRIIK